MMREGGKVGEAGRVGGERRKERLREGMKAAGKSVVKGRRRGKVMG